MMKILSLILYTITGFLMIIGLMALIGWVIQFIKDRNN